MRYSNSIRAHLTDVPAEIKVLHGHGKITRVEEEETVSADDDEDLYKSLERAMKVALEKQGAEASIPQAISLLAISTLPSQIAECSKS
ncbi:hypothetical protein OIU76_003827 [Salix suchowensis]|nr:hypothetical protein OIU76_003827 [Salix suchowensis]